ncbi:uncharacterized protein LOC112571328 [Pomacea canaliculata]|uniref:uncharacterized protein LOC112571328 n=1 Tax=Pomacea canaliculata TaxID=400727 RepID=UPI000D72630B|nr:uncharacterized protein LOC112571328 [Pomacea canaliculata]XP_025106029.1 uncharacterized protein LOC112571328 [Pomacea canaliculata]XP_025106030.1 uncharacterized protein LOC112571328 [Pomacea canaliculata]XP_025106031.1 uncharacterized protein LOC112571328 [Pomacea canaliculata]XP_025106032.1 uncharacterized protein LOC112571328 [Pomacea canaliculata]XP_025106033.1 uncharacterized protein LOC112571328 [Pomacea canaliculata]XP_025106034.1 uncharacterized protein LOC112571328 [Pomacea cana
MPCASPRLSSHNQHKTTQNRVKRLPQTAFHLPPRQYVENSLGRESVLPSARSDGAYGSAKAHHDALNQPLAQTASCVNSHVSQCTKVARSEHDSAICSINQYSCEAGSEQFLGNSACRYASQYVNPRGSEQYQGNSTFKEFTPGQTPRIVSSVPDIIGVQSHVDSQMSLRKQFSCSSKDDCREVAALMKKRSGTEGVGKHGLLERNKITHLCQGVQQFVEEKDVDVMRKIYKTNKTCRRTPLVPDSLLVVQPADQETDVVGESLVVASDKSECVQHVQLQSESIETTQSTPASHSAFCERIYPGKPDNVDNTSHRIEEEQLVITSGHSETHIKVVDVKKESKAMAFHPASEVSVTNTNNNSLECYFPSG